MDSAVNFSPHPGMHAQLAHPGMHAQPGGGWNQQPAKGRPVMPLVYDFVPNRTLEYHLHRKGHPVMDWPTRLKIAIGSAKGFAYYNQ